MARMNRNRTAPAIALWVVLAASAAASAGARTCTLELHDALPGGKTMDLSVALDGDKATAAFASARTYNTMPYTVDQSGLKVKSDRLVGKITVTVPSDGWVPKGGKSMTCTYALDVAFRKGKAIGTFEGSCDGEDVKGSVEGVVCRQGKLPKRSRFVLVARAPRGTTKEGLRKVGIQFGWHDGKAVGVKLVPAGSITDIGSATIVEKAKIDFDGRRLTGRIEGRLEHKGKGKRSLVVELDCTVIAARVSGQFTSIVDGEHKVTGGCRGELDLSDVPNPGNSIWKLTLQQGVNDGQMINVFVNTRKGKPVSAFAVTPNYNNATHEVDVSGLALRKDKLAGKIDVTVFPDAWVPKDHSKQKASYEIDARLEGAEVMGGYRGEFAGRKVRGDIEGHLQAKPVVGKVTHATIKPEGGLYDGSQAGYRAFFTFDLEDGRIIGGRVWNNHDKKLKGKITGGTFRIEDEVLTAEMVATIQPGTNAKAGTYTIRVKGPVMGESSCGSATSELGDKTWTSRYWASWEYDREEK